MFRRRPTAQRLGMIEGKGFRRAGAPEQGNVVRPGERERLGEVGEGERGRFVRRCRTSAIRRLCRRHLPDWGGRFARYCLGNLPGRFERRCCSSGQTGFERRCRLNGGAGFARQCLANPSLREGGKELAHVLQVLPGEAAAKPRGQIQRKPPQQGLPIAGASLAALFELHDAATRFPIDRGHDRVDSAGGGAAGLFEQAAEVAEEAVVAGFTRQGLH